MVDIGLCTDYDYIKSVIVDDPEMFDRCSDDYTQPEDYNLSKTDSRWLECRRDGERVGLSRIEHNGGSSINIHIHIPEQHRGSDTIEIGRAILTYIANTAVDNIAKINAKIPDIYGDVIAFSKKLGFQQEGIDRLSIMKGGLLINQIYMGITREEILAWVE